MKITDQYLEDVFTEPPLIAYKIQKHQRLFDQSNGSPKMAFKATEKTSWIEEKINAMHVHILRNAKK